MCKMWICFLPSANLAYKSALEEVNSLTKSKDIIHPYKVALGVICLQKVILQQYTLLHTVAHLVTEHTILRHV